MSLTKASYSMISGAPANILDYGAVGDGTTDDTSAIQAALAASSHVIVPIGTYLISSTVVVRPGCKLEFQGGIGNSAQNPTAYFIKKSTMTTWGITLGQSSVVTGGGLLGQASNTGNGIWLKGNGAILSNFWVKSIGGYGIKVGADATAFVNCNSTRIENVFVSYCTDHGVLVDDAYSTSAADANAGTISNCVSVLNGGSGIFIGFAWWVTIINSNTENNTGYGLYLSGDNRDSYPACRWANIVGGDYNEGNTAGVVYDASYFSTFVNPDGNNLPTTAPNGLQGSAARNYVGSISSVLQGLTVTTYPFTAQYTTGSGFQTPVTIQSPRTNSAGDGSGILFKTSDAGTAKNTAKIGSYYKSATSDGLTFQINIGDTITPFLLMDPTTNSLLPWVDNSTACGWSTNRWSVVYAATGTINTSDSREKQQGRSLSDVEKAVALKIKAGLKAFKWNEAVDKKGDKARWHFGVYAQDIAESFKSEGLNPNDYGMFCYDEWDEQLEVKDEDGNVTQAYISAGNRYGVRYEELLCFVIASL